MSQTPFLQQLRQKTDAELQQIVKSSPSLVGFEALDLTTGESFSYNKDMVFPQGSAIKIPVLMEVYKQAHDGKFRLPDRRDVKKEDIVGGSGVLKDLIDPASLTIRNLGVLMIVLSDNSATNSLLDLVGMDNINSTMASLGLKNTRVRRMMITPEASAKGEENTSTPFEAVSILKMLYDGKFAAKEISEELTAVLKKNSRGNSRLATGIPATVPIAFKPGELDGVSTEWAIVYLKERPYVVAVMQNYLERGTADHTMEDLSAVLYQYFWRLGNATSYGTYVNPDFLK